jgi:Tol biopolymer transport system component/DNA-binding winged helix-turn-helix (wHTH) protein
MAEPGESRSLVHFGVFELDLRAGQLRKHGIRVKLQEQPLQILALLVQYPGDVVTREQIHKKLWDGDTYVDFDNAINSAIRKMRDALGDDSENPRFVETLARRGYRFIAPVDQHLNTAPVAISAPVTIQEELALPRVTARHRAGWYWLGGVLCLASLLTGAGLMHWLEPRYMEPPTVETLTYSGRDSSPAVSPDGRTVAFSSDRDGTPRIWLKQLQAGGEVALTAGPDSEPRFSPDGSTILFSRSEGTHRSLYKVASVGGEPRKLIDDALGADFSPDGRHIAFLRWKRGDQHQTSVIGISAADGSHAVPIAELPNVRLYWPRWSPDGSALAMVGASATLAAGVYGVEVWVVRRDGQRLRRLTAVGPDRGISSVVWPDNRTILYVRGDRTTPVNAEVIAHDTATDTARRKPWPCCSLGLDLAGPGRLVFDQQANRSGLLELGRNDQAARWISHANSPDRQPVFSPDGKCLAFASNRDGHMNLWQISLKTGAISRLTEDKATNYDPAFSPDGTRLIFTSDRTGHFEIYLANRDGSGASQVTQDGVDAQNATMTADGQWLVYASANPAKSGIWKIHPDGSAATQLVRGIGNNPEVSPDGVYVLYITTPQPDLAEIHVARISDGSEVPFRIQCWRHKENAMALGRARWIPSSVRSDAMAIAFIGQDATGATGVYLQDFVPGHDTATTRKPLRPFDPIAPLETLAVSPDGKKLVVSVADDTSSILLASNVPELKTRKASSSR